jgi:hypothetical protein
MRELNLTMSSVIQQKLVIEMFEQIVQKFRQHLAEGIFLLQKEWDELQEICP